MEQLAFEFFHRQKLEREDISILAQWKDVDLFREVEDLVSSWGSRVLLWTPSTHSVRRASEADQTTFA